MSEQAVIVALLTAAAYLGWCAIYPYTACPRCSGAKTAGDGHGNYRLRRRCWMCGGKPFRRVGARLIGAGRRKE